MKKSLLFLFSLFLIVACAEENPNSDLFGSDSFGNNASNRVDGPVMDYVALVGNGQFDNTTDNGTGISLNGTGANLNMAERLGAYNKDTGEYHNRMPAQSMKGVWFPHDFHRRLMNRAEFVGTDDKPYTPIQGCGSCHNLYEGGSLSTFLKRSIDAGRININADNNTAGTASEIVQGGTADNPAHAFCWNACHSKIAQPNQAPTQNDCGRCHRLTNMREERLKGDPWAAGVEE